MVTITLSKWQMAEVLLIFIGVLQIVLRWKGVHYPYQMEAIFTPIFIVTLGYLFSAFGSVYFLWKLSKGLIPVSFLLYIHAYMISTAFLYHYMNWLQAEEMAVASYLFIGIGFIVTFIYYLIEGRKKTDLFKRIVAPLVIRSFILDSLIIPYLLIQHGLIGLLGDLRKTF